MWQNVAHRDRRGRAAAEKLDSTFLDILVGCQCHEIRRVAIRTTELGAPDGCTDANQELVTAFFYKLSEERLSIMTTLEDF